MIILPAIDLKDGKCVRLFQGDYATAEQVAELEAKLSHEQSEKESAQSALARLNEQLTTLKMTLEANSADKAVVDKAPVEAMDAAGSV